jgi:succinylglutamic semialdehyde dehydrogenase
MSDLLRSTSPADPEDVLGEFPVAGAREVAAAVARAREAFPAWRDIGQAARFAVVRKFADAAQARAPELATLIAREVGKALWEAKAESGLLPAKVDLSLGPGMELIAPQDVGGGARSSIHPRGVLAVLGPFNFPAHLPNGHIVPALATGNTVVFKPSEQAPAVGAWMLDVWREAGLPEGVLEVVQGGAETGHVLAVDEDVDGVLFTGSWNVGRALAEATLDQPGKILALEMGGKNAMIVWEDADLPLDVAEAALSIAATTGQRCTCLSRVFVHRAFLEPFAAQLTEVLAGLRIGMPLEQGVFMGPLVSAESADRVARVRASAEAAGGARLPLPPIDHRAPWVGPGLVRFPDCAQTSAYQRDELFAPEAALYPVDDLDEAIAAVNDSDYGLAASVMSTDRRVYTRCIGRVETGILNWNKGTVGASGKLPFGGTKRSGNDRPAGVSAALYCTTPQAHLEGDGRFDPASLPPGMPAPADNTDADT